MPTTQAGSRNTSEISQWTQQKWSLLLNYWSFFGLNESGNEATFEKKTLASCIIILQSFGRFSVGPAHTGSELYAAYI